MKAIYYGILFVVFCSSCDQYEQAKLILGPTDKPNYAQKDWKEMSIRYRIRVGREKTIERKFSYDNSEMIKKKFIEAGIREISPSSTGVENQIVLMEVDGAEWYCKIIFSDRIKIGSSSDKGYVHYVDLNNDTFRNWLRSICCENEKNYNPNISEKYIILRSNRSLKDCPLWRGDGEQR